VLVLIGSIPRCLARGAKRWASVSAEKTEHFTCEKEGMFRVPANQSPCH
jgi:hypothetical protein